MMIKLHCKDKGVLYAPSNAICIARGEEQDYTIVHVLGGPANVRVAETPDEILQLILETN